MFHEPFLKNSELERLVKVKTSYLPTKQEKAERLFKWMRKNIEYDYEKSEEEGISYRNSLETYYDRKGLCGEQTYLYVTLARIAGINAWFEYVEETVDNKEHHACAGVKLEDRVVYVDTTYGDFGIQHNKSSRMSDKEAARHYFL